VRGCDGVRKSFGHRSAREKKFIPRKKGFKK